jgi:magnesium transporter
MTPMPDTIEAPAKHRALPRERVEDALADITALLRKHRLVEGLVAEQRTAEAADAADAADASGALVDSAVTRQNKAELVRKLDRLHAADVAHLLEALPLDERLYVWNLVRAARDGDILLEVSDAVRESLISSMDTEELVAATETLEADEIAELAPDLPREVMDDVLDSLPVEEREQLRAAMSFDEDMVGALMDFEDISVRPDVTLEVVLRYLRRFDELPSQTDQLFVVDRDEKLQGTLPVHRLLVTDPATLVRDVMQPLPVKLLQHEKAGDAASAFERYDLVTAPVVDTNDKLVGRVTVDEILDFVKQRGQEEVLAQAGLREEEDVFASVWKSFQNRWAWLAINLVTAFVASRVIGVFEGSIQKLVALAALMPIVAGIGGNSGNQTITMIVRAAALGQVSREHARKLIEKELAVALLNGLIWGGVMGVIAMLLYKQVSLGLVMVLAMTMNLLLAAIMGVLIPMTMIRLGRDPAVGSSVMITAVTDSGGFFIFLGLATLFLV